MNEKYFIPVSIVVAGIIVGLALFFTGGKASDENSEKEKVFEQKEEEQVGGEARKVDPDVDHILGSPDAELFLIEYSDLECPYCKVYHDNINKKLAAEYVSSGKVAFVFRHFPLDEPYTRALHPTATEEAIASECVAELGDNGKFFAFIDEIFATTNSDGNYDLSKLAGMAEAVGVDREAFQKCYDGEETKEKVTAQFNEGSAAGVAGTPTIIAQTSDGTNYPAQPDYDSLKNAIEMFLEEN